jgi:hypothetical protein
MQERAGASCAAMLSDDQVKSPDAKTLQGLVAMLFPEGIGAQTAAQLTAALTAQGIKSLNDLVTLGEDWKSIASKELPPFLFLKLFKAIKQLNASS